MCVVRDWGLGEGRERARAWRGEVRREVRRASALQPSAAVVLAAAAATSAFVSAAAC
jgi:hypothetical protein